MELGRRIKIIGSAGSGKSTLARQMGEKLDIPVAYLDAWFWGPHWEPNPAEAFLERVKGEAEKPAWIMEGNYSATLEPRLQRAQSIIFLDMGRLRCLYRVIRRYWNYRGKIRPDIAEGCEEKLDWAFIQYIWTDPKRSRKKRLQLLERVKGDMQTYHLVGKRDVDRFWKGFLASERNGGMG